MPRAPAPDSLTATSFDWTLVRSFLAVLDAGSLLGAARRLGSTQPTVGRQIEAFERQIGQPLFERTGRGVTPTDAARRIAAEARRMQQGAERLAAAAASGPGEMAGLVRITASRKFAVHVLPRMIAALQIEAPEIDIALVASDEVSNLLRRDADIAVRMVDPEQGSLIARRIGKVPVVAVAHRDYIARHGLPRSLPDLLQHRLIGPDHDTAVVEQMRRLAISLGHLPDAVPRNFRSDDYVVQMAAVRAGLGIGFLTESWPRSDPDLVIVPLPLPTASLPVWLAVHREIRGNRRIRFVYDFLARELGALYG
ncbi:MAG: LysR family transcriptional regulator [Burkholderiaceae bacterium]